MRCWFVILVLALFPRLMFAWPGNELLCIADDHVQVGCHEAGSEGCDDEPESKDDGDSPEPCVDLLLPGDAVQAQRATVPLAELPAMPWIIECIGEALNAPLRVVVLIDDPPRAFCARAFTCSIVIRC